VAVCAGPHAAPAARARAAAMIAEGPLCCHRELLIMAKEDITAMLAGVRLRPSFLAVLSLLPAAAGCSGTTHHEYNLFGANARRDSLVFVDEKALVVRRGEVERAFPRNTDGCLKDAGEADWLYLFPAADRVLLEGFRANSLLHFHVGSHTGISCLVDLR